MGLFFLLAAGFMGLGALLGAPMRLRWAMIAVLYLMVVIAHAVLPSGNGISALFGGTFGGWIVAGAAALLIWIYALWVRRMRTKRREMPTQSKPGTFSEAELDRYARHIVLREIGGAGQKRLKAARVLVIGAGGLGSPALMYLAAAGIGTIGVVDDDEVDASNLQRQIIHDDTDIGVQKVESASAKMAALNPFITIRPYGMRLTGENAEALIADYDVVLDGCDNFETRYLTNRTCAKLGKPLIAAALTQWEGQLSVYDPKNGTPCFQCVFPNAPVPELAPACAEAGVLSPLPGVVGSMMAVETIKLITGAGETLRSTLLIYDALFGENRKIALKPRKDCPVCGVDGLQHSSDRP